MARLVRKTQKIFAENAPNSKVTAFGSIKADPLNPIYTKDVAELQTTAFTDGWSAALQGDYAPYRQDENAIDLVTTKQLSYVFQEGTPEYDAGTTYYIGSIVKSISGSDYKLYHSLINDNIGYPLTDNTKWKLDFDSSLPTGMTISGSNATSEALQNIASVANAEGREKIASYSIAKYVSPAEPLILPTIAPSRGMVIVTARPAGANSFALVVNGVYPVSFTNQTYGNQNGNCIVNKGDSLTKEGSGGGTFAFLPLNGV